MFSASVHASRKVQRCSRSLQTLTGRTRDQLRELLRETAQPVAVVTTLLEGSALISTGNTIQSAYHGATLSSFTSIALDPYPLVAFSLRVPSRTAAALNSHVDRTQADAESLNTSHMVINILSAALSDVAVTFSRADLHPRPFVESRVQWTKSADGLPIISGSLGALSCALVSRSLPLGDLRWLRKCHPLPRTGEGVDISPGEEQGGSTSELFIARVLRVEHVPQIEGDEERDGMRTLPLLYHRRKYATAFTIC